MGDSVGHCFPRAVSPPAQVHATNLFMSTKGLTELPDFGDTAVNFKSNPHPLRTYKPGGKTYHQIVTIHSGPICNQGNLVGDK